MTVGIIGMIIGLLVAGAGAYYYSKEKSDKESARIYSAITAIGAVVAAVCLALSIFA